MTEKYVQSLEAGAVPVVIGATNMDDFAVAPNSMLVIRVPEEVPAVARRLQQLLVNDTAYAEMLAWKQVQQGPVFAIAWCGCFKEMDAPSLLLFYGQRCRRCKFTIQYLSDDVT